jgi:hypothetical protein
MAPRAHSVFCGFVLLFFAAALPARADPIKVTFTVFAAPGDPVNTAPSTGSFTFDSSLIPPGGGRVENLSGLGALDVNFAWSHTLWTTSNADLAELRFSPSGRLLAFFLAGIPAGLTGFQTGPPEAVVDDFAILSFQADSGAGFQYTNAGNPEVLFGGVTTNLQPIPEPSSIVLLTTGVVLVLRRRTWWKKSRIAS